MVNWPLGAAKKKIQQRKPPATGFLARSMSHYVDDAAEGSGSEAAHEDDYASGDEDGADLTLDGFVVDGSGSDEGSGSDDEEPGVRPRLPGDESSDGESPEKQVAALRQRHGHSRRAKPAHSDHRDGGESAEKQVAVSRQRRVKPAHSDHSDDDDGGEAQGNSDDDDDGEAQGDSDEDRMETDHSGDEEEGGARRPPRRRPRGAAAPVGHGSADLTQPVELVGAYDR